MAPSEDAERWNERYKSQKRYSFESARPFLVENAHFLPSEGLILDAAMGLGGNAAFLINRGLGVVGVDISEVAVRRAMERLPELMAFVGDLTQIRFPRACFDAILNFYYLQRDLWVNYRHSLKPGGLLVIETLTVDMLQIQPDIESGYLLQKGELLEAFRDLEVLVYREGWKSEGEGHRRAAAGIVARKPGKIP